MKKQLALFLAATLGAWSSAAWADPPTPTPGSESTHGGSPLRTAGWYTAGAGVAILSTSAVFFVMAKNDHNELMENRGPQAADGFDRHFTTAKMLAVAGIVGVATGVTLILVAAKHEVALSAGPGQLTLSGSF